MSVEATDLVILEKAIKAVASAKKALIKEIAAGAGKARFHAQTFTQVSTALDQLESMRVGKAKATKPKVTKEEVV
tara:strand:- start:103 stop:327 length:225 start_codon:yes stop_codon:yes gene_type:complete